MARYCLLLTFIEMNRKQHAMRNSTIHFLSSASHMQEHNYLSLRHSKHEQEHIQIKPIALHDPTPRCDTARGITPPAARCTLGDASCRLPCVEPLSLHVRSGTPWYSLHVEAHLLMQLGHATQKEYFTSQT